MQFALLVYAEEAQFAAFTEADGIAVMAKYTAYSQTLHDAGVYVTSGRLRPVGTATSVRGKAGSIQVVDGPFADTKEGLGGFYMIDVPDLDAALDWAKRCPGTELGTIEVRPIWPMGEA